MTFFLKLTQSDPRFREMRERASNSARRLHKLREALRLESIEYRKSHDVVTTYFKQKYFRRQLIDFP